MYESFYGLSGKPFQLNPDPSFLYASRGHKGALAYLKYGLYQAEGFVVITGEVGAGKTTIIRSLLELLDSGNVVAAQLVSTQLDEENLLRAVATAFGLPAKAQPKAQLLAELDAVFTTLVQGGKRALLIVDEAQNLPPRGLEELRMLSNFQIEDRSLLQSILVGQPELRDIMRSHRMRQLRQRVVASYHLGPMDRNETEGYIEHRLAHVGWKGDPRFDSAAMDQIHAATGGVPRRINTVCNRLLLSGYLEERHEFDGDSVAAVVAEMKDEGGLDLASTQASVPAPADPDYASTGSFGGDLPGDLIDGSDSLEQLSKGGLPQRLMRVERTVLTMLDLMNRLMHRDRGNRKKRSRVK